MSGQIAELSSYIGRAVRIGTLVEWQSGIQCGGDIVLRGI
jgi:hypothetical protein